MSLFKIEGQSNFIGIHTFDLYYIEIGEKNKKTTRQQKTYKAVWDQ